MGARPYHNQLINDLSGVLQNMITVLSLLVNLMLLRILKTSKRSGMGSYQYLIAFFCMSDIYYTVIHWLVYPIPETYKSAFLMKGHGFFHSRLGPCMYSAAYFQAFPIVAFHFLYRALAIQKPRILQEPARFFTALVLTTCGTNLLGLYIAYFMFAPDPQGLSLLEPFIAGNSTPVIHKNIDPSDYMQTIYWAGETFSQPRWRNLIGSGISIVIIVVAYFTIITCCLLINNFLKTNAASSKTMKLHRQIYRSLICQVIYPLLTTYYPLSVCVIFPMFGISFNWVSVFCPPSCVSHPLCDPLFLIACIPEYRNAFLRMLGLSKYIMRQSTTTVQTSMVSAVRPPSVTHTL